ncbi:unnamed protein product, partial [Fusarium graminearum]
SRLYISFVAPSLWVLHLFTSNPAKSPISAKNGHKQQILTATRLRYQALDELVGKAISWLITVSRGLSQAPAQPEVAPEVATATGGWSYPGRLCRCLAASM